MRGQLFFVFIGAVLLQWSVAMAHPMSWIELSSNFHSMVSSHGRLKPHFEKNVGNFFSIYIDYSREQLLYIEPGSQDTILNFLAFNCHGILKRLLRGHQDQDRLLQLASEHLFYQALIRLDWLSYWELCHVINYSLAGKYNVLHALIERDLLAARDRIFYFLIDKSHNQFELTSSRAGNDTPSLIDLTKRALNDAKVRRALEAERNQLLQPVVESWEDALRIGNFLEIALGRQQRARFLTQVMTIAGDL